MVTTNDDVNRYYSGGSANANPQLSYGGAKSSVRIPLDTLNAVWDDTTDAEASLGDVEVRVIYFQYDGVDPFVKNVTVYLGAKARGVDDTIEYAIDPTVGVNQLYPARGNENDPPTDVAWTNGTTRTTGRLLAAKLNRGEFAHCLLRRTITAGAAPLEGEDYILTLEFDPEGGSGTGGGTGGGDTTTFKLMVTVGDTGADTDAKTTEKNFKKRIDEGCKVVQFLGDFSYGSSAKPWTDIFDPIKSKCKLLVMGNHETVDGSSSLTKAYLNWIGQSKQWGSYIIGDVCVVVGSHYQSFGSGSEQYIFIDKALKDASKNANIKWIITCHHEPMFTGSAKHGADSSWKSTYHPLYDKYGVDLDLCGHNHEYQRTHPLTNGGTAHDQTEAPDYRDPTGTIFIVCGNGGRDYYAVSGVSGGIWAKPNPKPTSGANDWSNNLFDSKVGYLMLEEQTDGGKLIGKFCDGSNNVKDQWSIRKGSGNTTPPPVSATTAQNADTGFPATNATDGDLNTRWRTGTNPTWIKVDLGSNKAVSFIDIAWVYGNPNREYTFNVQSSTDNTNWNTIIPDRGSVNSGDKIIARYTFSTVTARYFRVNVKGNTEDDYASMWEVQVGDFGPGPTSAQLAVSVMTSTSDDGTHIPTNANDGNLTTYWFTTVGNPCYIRADLGSIRTLNAVELAFFKGVIPDGRTHMFNVETSNDNTNWTQVIGDRQNGETDGSLEHFNFPNPILGRYIRINIKGNDLNDEAGLYEFDCWGS